MKRMLKSRWALYGLFLLAFTALLTARYVVGRRPWGEAFVDALAAALLIALVILAFELLRWVIILIRERRARRK